MKETAKACKPDTMQLESAIFWREKDFETKQGPSVDAGAKIWADAVLDLGQATCALRWKLHRGLQCFEMGLIPGDTSGTGSDSEAGSKSGSEAGSGSTAVSAFESKDRKNWSSLPELESRPNWGLALSLRSVPLGEALKELEPKRQRSWLQEQSGTVQPEGCQGDEPEKKIDGARQKQILQLRFALPEDAKIYGLGDVAAPLNRRGYSFTLWNTDDPSVQLEHRRSLYKSIPILFIHSRQEGFCLGLFFDQSARAHFDLAFSDREALIYTPEASALRLYVTKGRHLSEVQQRLAHFFGGRHLPARRMLGFHQSRWSYASQSEVSQVVSAFDRHQLPLSVLHLDIDYMDGFRDFTWHPKHFGDGQKLVHELEEKEIALVPIIDAGIKQDEAYEVYQRGLTGGHFLKAEDGQPYVGWVWPGHTVYPDFEQKKTRDWWAKEVESFVQKSGVSGIWLDMNEPANFNGDLPDELRSGAYENAPLEQNTEAVFADGSLHKDWHNRYGSQMSLATYHGLQQARPNQRPFLFSRACYAGQQAYAGVWTGDSISLWAALRAQVAQLLTLNLCGIHLLGGDIGGFGGQCTAELMIRWMQLGCFMPLMRNHTEINSAYQEPWCFGQETLEILRKCLNWRYRFLPYLYDEMAAVELGEGLPLWRTLAMMHPDDARCDEIQDAFYFGSQMLVAPVLDPAVRERVVYLPQGLWYRLEDFKVFDCREGGRSILCEANLDHCPIFVKAGALIPSWSRPQEPCRAQERNSCDQPKELTLLAFAPHLAQEDEKVSVTEKSLTCEEERFHLVDAGDGFAYREAFAQKSAVQGAGLYRFYWQEGEPTYQYTGDPKQQYEKVNIVLIEGDEA